MVHIAVRANHLTTTGNHTPYQYGITQYYLPPVNSVKNIDFPAFTLIASTRFSDPRGMQS